MGPSKSKHKFITLFILLFSVSFSYGFTRTVEDKVINSLIQKIEQKIRQYPQLVCGVYIKHIGAKNVKSTISVNGNSAFPAASLIKIPIAVVLLKKIDKGQISWDETLTLKTYHYAQGAGILRTKKTGTKIKLKEVFRFMLLISDNTATNMVIDLLGGVKATNQEIAKLNLKNTRLNNWLGDFKGTNKTSPCDLVTILEESLEGQLLSSDSRKYFRSTLLKVKNKSLIKKGLGRYTKFAHKTGTIGICVGDAGIIYFPISKKIGISIIVKRPFNSLNGQKIIREISNLVYEHLG